MLNGSSGQAWAQVDTGANNWNLSTANPRTGTHHLRMGSGTGSALVRRVFGTTLTEVFFGQAMYFSDLPAVEPVPGSMALDQGFHLAKFRDMSNQVMVSVWVGTDGGIYVCRGGDNNVGGTFTATILDRCDPIVGAGAYQHYEHYLKIGSSDGAYELRVDEVTVINLTGINTDNGGGEVSQVTVGRYNGDPFGSGTGNIDMADCYVNDTVDDGSGCNTWIGDCKSGWRPVNADTAQADFALSAGVSGYELLDETPPNDSDYIDTTSSTARSDFGFVNGPGNESEILTARPAVRAWKDDAGTCEIAPSLQSNAVDATVSPQPITTAPAYYDSNVPLNPDTGVPWTPAELNAAFQIVERTS